MSFLGGYSIWKFNPVFSYFKLSTPSVSVLAWKAHIDLTSTIHKGHQRCVNVDASMDIDDAHGVNRPSNSLQFLRNYSTIQRNKFTFSLFRVTIYKFNFEITRNKKLFIGQLIWLLVKFYFWKMIREYL